MTPTERERLLDQLLPPIAYVLLCWFVLSLS
jgi:hypothetical protein